MPRGVRSNPNEAPHERATRRIEEIDVKLAKLSEERSRLSAERKKCEEVLEKHRNALRTSVINAVIEKVPADQHDALLTRLASMTKEEVSSLLGAA